MKVRKWQSYDSHRDLPFPDEKAFVASPLKDSLKVIFKKSRIASACCRLSVTTKHFSKHWLKILLVSEHKATRASVRSFKPTQNS